MRETGEMDNEMVSILDDFSMLLEGGIQGRKVSDEFDYGDGATAGLQLKLVDYDTFDPEMRFGMFVPMDGKFGVIRYHAPVGWRMHVIEIFDTMEEMKKRWRLD